MRTAEIEIFANFRSSPLRVFLRGVFFQPLRVHVSYDVLCLFPSVHLYDGSVVKGQDLAPRGPSWIHFKVVVASPPKTIFFAIKNV